MPPIWRRSRTAPASRSSRVGGGSKRALGRPRRRRPARPSAARGHGELRAGGARAYGARGTPLAEIEAALRAHGQRLAFEPPDFGALLGVEAPQTLGGVLAANLAGSRRVVGGAARDHFLGFSAVDGLGERFKAGGKVVKNVTGYDLPKLLAGSWGTLAVLTEVTIRVAPAPEVEQTLGCARRASPAHASRCSARRCARRTKFRRGVRSGAAMLAAARGFRGVGEARARALCDELVCPAA